MRVDQKPQFTVIGPAEPSDEFVEALARLLLSLVCRDDEPADDPKPERKPREQSDEK